MLIDDFNHTIDSWINGLDHYTYNQLCRVPSRGGWSLGQLYMHLIGQTSYYMAQMESCISNDDHTDKEPSPEGRIMLHHNDFPDKQLEGPPENALTPQPGSKEMLRAQLLEQRTRINKIMSVAGEGSHKGRTKHPGLGYFNAIEWLQFSDMHFRHHLRQKKRIDGFLSGNE